MYIIRHNKFDYYDTALSYLSEPDKSVVFDRKQSVHNIDLLHLNDVSRRWFNKSTNVEFKEYLLLFCGQIFPILEIYEYKSGESVEYKTDFFFDSKSVISYLESIQYTFKKTRWISSSRSDNGSKDYFISFFNIRNTFEHLHHEFKSPIILIEKSIEFSKGNKVIINPILKDYKIQKIISPTEAFQNIYMFVGGVLTNNPKMPDSITDEIKRDQHGFDKFSFKRMKGDKK